MLNFDNYVLSIKFYVKHCAYVNKNDFNLQYR